MNITDLSHHFKWDNLQNIQILFLPGCKCLHTLEIVGSAFLLDPCDALFSLWKPCCIHFLNVCAWWEAQRKIYFPCSPQGKSLFIQIQSSGFSSSPLCLRVKNPS